MSAFLLEYQNEHVLRGVLLDTKQDHHTPARPELFVVTKVLLNMYCVSFVVYLHVATP